MKMPGFGVWRCFGTFVAFSKWFTCQCANAWLHFARVGPDLARSNSNQRRNRFVWKRCLIVSVRRVGEELFAMPFVELNQSHDREIFPGFKAHFVHSANMTFAHWT